MSIEQVLGTIERYQRFLITSHIMLEGDAIGSQLGMESLLKKMGKTVSIIDHDAVPMKYRFLPHSSYIRPLPDKKMDFQVAFVLDCPHMKRIGKVSDLIDKNTLIVNIDHHISNENFGNVNWVDTGASSAGEMIYHLFEHSGYEIDRDVALALYVAILTDTGSFRYRNTTPNTHKVSARLLECGLSVEEIAGHIYWSNTFTSMKLLGLVLSHLAISEDGKVAWLRVTNEMLKRSQAKPEETEDFIDFARSVAGAELALFFQEVKEKNEVKVSFRSRGSIDVNKIAVSFGGGGHQGASGCTIKGSVDEAEKMVLKKVKEAIEESYGRHSDCR